MAIKASSSVTASPTMVRWTTAQIIEFQRKVLREAGQDPSLVPDEPFRFLALKDVKTRLSLSTTTIYRAMRAGKFPRPVALDNVSSRAKVA